MGYIRNKSFSNVESAYRANVYTETALLKLHDTTILPIRRIIRFTIVLHFGGSFTNVTFDIENTLVAGTQTPSTNSTLNS